MAQSFLDSLLNRTPVPYVKRSGASGWWGWAAGSTPSEQHMSAYGVVGTLFSIVSQLASDVASVGWHLHRAATGGTCDTCEEPGVVRVETHAALSVWNKPNSFFTGHEFVETFQQHIDLTGEGWWVATRDVDFPGLGPIELWPVRPDRMAPVKHPTKYLTGYIYTGPEGEKVPLDLNEVVQIRMPNPLDPYRGLGPVQSLLVDLDSTRYSAEWNRNFFLNSAEPGGVLQMDDTLDDRDFDRLKEEWSEEHRGVSRAHRVAILEKGKWIPRSFSQRDMQFAELRDVSRDVIREAFAMHKHMLGGSDTVNRANADAAEYTYGRRQMVPRLDRIKDALDSKFLPMFGADRALSWAYTNPVPDDREADDRERNSKADAFARLVRAGVDPLDAAAFCGMPPMRVTAPAQPDRELDNAA